MYFMGMNEQARVTRDVRLTLVAEGAAKRHSKNRELYSSTPSNSEPKHWAGKVALRYNLNSLLNPPARQQVLTLCTHPRLPLPSSLGAEELTLSKAPKTFKLLAVFPGRSQASNLIL